MLFKNIEGGYRSTFRQRLRRGAPLLVLMATLAMASCGEASANNGIPASGVGSGPAPSPTATMGETPTPIATATAYPYPTLTPKPQSTPYGQATVTDIQLKPGECIDLQPGDPTAYVSTGDVLVGTDVNHLQRGYDDRQNTGMELTIQGTQPVTECAPYGADIRIIQGANPQVVNKEELDAIQQLRRNGCENGCSEGVQTFSYKDSNLVFEGMK